MKGEEGTSDPEGVGAVEATPVLRLDRESLCSGVVLYEAGDLGRGERQPRVSEEESGLLASDRACPGWPTLLLQAAGRAVRQPALAASPGHRAVPRLVRLRLSDPPRRPPLHSDEHHVPHSKGGELVSPEEVPHSRDEQALPRGQGDRQPGWREDHRLSPAPGPRALVTLPLGQTPS